MLIVSGTLDQPARFVLTRGSDRTIEASIAAFVSADFLARFPREQADDLGEKSRKSEALPLFIAAAPFLRSLSKLLPDKHYRCIARIRGNRET